MECEAKTTIHLTTVMERRSGTMGELFWSTTVRRGFLWGPSTTTKLLNPMNSLSNQVTSKQCINSSPLVHFIWKVYCVQKPKYYRRRVWEAWGRGRAGVVQGEEGRQGRSLSRKLRWAAHLARLNRLWHWERSTSWWVSRYTAVTMQLPHEENSEIQEFYGHQLNLILLKSEIEQNGCNWDV